MDIHGTLKKIGLTDSEVKVYLALLKLETSSKGAIVKESKIAHSKIYDVLNKLIDKGLASTIIKNNVNYYSAAPVTRLKDYLNLKQEELKHQETIINDILPRLSAIQNEVSKEVKAELFLGWKGMETVYSTLMLNSKKGDFAYILGASEGKDPENTERFFNIYATRAKQKGIIVKTIFNESSRNYVKNLEKKTNIVFEKKFLFKNTPVEFLISKNTSAIVMLKEEPIVLLIKDVETANSFNAYFQELWKIAAK